MTFVWALAALQAQYFIQMSAVLCYNDLNYPGILKEFVQKDIDLEVRGNHFSWNNVGGEGGGWLPEIFFETRLKGGHQETWTSPPDVQSCSADAGSWV